MVRVGALDGLSGVCSQASGGSAAVLISCRRRPL